MIAVSIRDSSFTSPLDFISSSASYCLSLDFLNILIKRSSERIDLVRIKRSGSGGVKIRWANDTKIDSGLCRGALRLGGRIERRVI